LTDANEAEQNYNQRQQKPKQGIDIKKVTTCVQEHRFNGHR